MKDVSEKNECFVKNHMNALLERSSANGESGIHSTNKKLRRPNIMRNNRSNKTTSDSQTT